MITALIDNGSLEPAAVRHLRATAAELGRRTDTHVHAVSWKHSDRITECAQDAAPPWTLAPFIRSMHALGQREFLFVPFFISAQGAIGSALHRDIEALQRDLGGFEFKFTAGLAARGAIPGIMVERIRETILRHSLGTPPVVLVDHGGPSAASARLRDQIADQVRRELGAAIRELTAASMEGQHPPLLADALNRADFSGRNVVVARLFLSPGRHAGAHGDVARLCLESPAHCHLTELVGTHPAAIDALAAALRAALVARSQAAAPEEAGSRVR